MGDCYDTHWQACKDGGFRLGEKHPSSTITICFRRISSSVELLYFVSPDYNITSECVQPIDYMQRRSCFDCQPLCTSIFCQSVFTDQFFSRPPFANRITQPKQRRQNSSIINDRSTGPLHFKSLNYSSSHCSHLSTLIQLLLNLLNHNLPDALPAR